MSRGNPWTGESLSSCRWPVRLAGNLSNELQCGSGDDRSHESAIVAVELRLPHVPARATGWFAQVAREQHPVSGDAVAACMQTCIAEKSRTGTWTRRRRPRWFVERLLAPLKEAQRGKGVGQ